MSAVAVPGSALKQRLLEDSSVIAVPKAQSEDNFCRAQDPISSEILNLHCGGQDDWEAIATSLNSKSLAFLAPDGSSQSWTAQRVYARWRFASHLVGRQQDAERKRKARIQAQAKRQGSEKQVNISKSDKDSSTSTADEDVSEPVQPEANASQILKGAAVQAKSTGKQSRKRTADSIDKDADSESTPANEAGFEPWNSQRDRMLVEAYADVSRSFWSSVARRMREKLSQDPDCNCSVMYDASVCQTRFEQL